MLLLKNISWSVGQVPILKDISLSVETGKAIGIVWPNGCGKTSLLNIINGFRLPNHGTLSFLWEDITKLSVEQRAHRGIGRVFQSFGIIKSLTLYENLALAFVTRLSWIQQLKPTSKLPKPMKDEIDSILHELTLYEKRHQKAGDLSGGQMRLLELGRLYLQNTQLFLLDEPTAGVAPKLKGTVVKLLNKILQTGKTVIIVEHDFRFLAEFVDTFFVMDDGRVVLSGDHQSIKNSDLIKEIYFW